MLNYFDKNGKCWIVLIVVEIKLKLSNVWILLDKKMIFDWDR